VPWVLSSRRAEANGETLTGFLLTAGTERAEAVLERVRSITVSAAAFKRFMTALNEDATPDPMPTLTRYARESSPVPSR
jgi:uncharacterized protein (DUF1778 family)